MTQVHILRPHGHYVGQLRRRGNRRWVTTTGRCHSCAGALRQVTAGEELARAPGERRVRVLFIDGSGWYEPNVVFEGAWI